MEASVTVEVSARHVHLTGESFKQLFGAGESLHEARPISQPGQFAATERVTLRGPQGELRNVRVVGPFRKYNQVELAITDARLLGINPPLRDSGSVVGSAPITLIGPAGTLELPEDAIIQERHLHASPQDASRLGLRDRQLVQCRIDGLRGAVLKHILVRIDPRFVLRLHLDTDEANALGVTSGAEARLLL